MTNYKPKFKVTYDKSAVKNGYKPKQSNLIVNVRKYSHKMFILTVTTVFVTALAWYVTRVLDSTYPKTPPVQQPQNSIQKNGKLRKDI